jgi:hypothetical protein
MTVTEETTVLRENPVPLLLCPPQIPQTGLQLNPGSEVTGQHLPNQSLLKIL